MSNITAAIDAAYQQLSPADKATFDAMVKTDALRESTGLTKLSTLFLVFLVEGACYTCNPFDEQYFAAARQELVARGALEIEEDDDCTYFLSETDAKDFLLQYPDMDVNVTVVVDGDVVLPEATTGIITA